MPSLNKEVYVLATFSLHLKMYARFFYEILIPFRDYDTFS